MTNQNPKVRIPSDITRIRKISEDIESFLRSRGVDESTVFDMRLCAEEAIKNAIIHGNKNKMEKSVSISYSLDGNRFTLRVEDEGDGFDDRKVPDPTSGDNLLRAGGRGVFLIKKLMDEVQYKGNKVLMVKFLKQQKGLQGGGDAV